MTHYLSGDSDQIQYQKLTFDVVNAQAGQNLGILLQDDGVPVVYSTGPNFQTYSGIKLESAGGANLPLTQFSINPAQVQVQTQSGGSTGSLAFTITTYLAAQPGIRTFYLQLNTPAPGVQVKARVGDQEGQTVDTRPPLFSWNPK